MNDDITDPVYEVFTKITNRFINEENAINLYSFNNYNIAIFNSSFFIDEIAEKILNNNPTLDFVINFYILKNSIKFTFISKKDRRRKSDNSVNVLEVSKKYGSIGSSTKATFSLGKNSNMVDTNSIINCLLQNY